MICIHLCPVQFSTQKAYNLLAIITHIWILCEKINCKNKKKENKLKKIKYNCDSNKTGDFVLNFLANCNNLTTVTTNFPCKCIYLSISDEKFV